MSETRDKHRSIEILHRIRTYALELEEVKLMERQREELVKKAEAQQSLGVLQDSLHHSVAGAHAHDYARRDGCIREAGSRHNVDMRELGLAQIARREQVEATLQAKTRADMLARVLENRRAEDTAARDARDRKETDDISQNQYTHRLRAEPAAVL